jgi:hypothetical protein
MTLIDDLKKLVTQNTHKIYQYPQATDTASYRSDVDIWRHIENNFWGRDYNNNLHGGFSKGSETSFNNRITDNFNDIKKQENRITSSDERSIKSKAHRDLNASKIEDIFKRLDNKANANHSHAGENIINQIKGFALGGGTASIILIGAGAFLLLRSKALKKVL